MRKFANSNKVNYGIALALFGILFFSLMSSVEGMIPKTPAETKTPADEIKDAVAGAIKQASASVSSKKEGLKKKSSIS
jgi:hypothetical protein